MRVFSENVKRVESENSVVYLFSSWKCETCNEFFPFNITTPDGKVLSLLQYDNLAPGADYMVWENVGVQEYKWIYIFWPTPEKHALWLGRSEEADLIINDESVSELHAVVRFEPGHFARFVLLDNQSQFGTLVLVKDRTPILLSYSKAI